MTDFDRRRSLIESEKGHGDAELLVLETDKALLTDPVFRPHAERFAADQEAFFAQYALSHKKLSELGARFDPHNGISIAGTRSVNGRVIDATY